MPGVPDTTPAEDSFRCFGRSSTHGHDDLSEGALNWRVDQRAQRAAAVAAAREQTLARSDCMPPPLSLLRDGNAVSSSSTPWYA
jgi:hypothetical protein